MRRLLLIVSLVAVCVGLFPARADAYFWEWIDSLSGPRFKGFQIDYRVWCGYEKRDPPLSGKRLGLIVSLCKTHEENTRLVRSLAVNVQWGQDAKDSHYEEFTRPDGSTSQVDNKMVGVGANYMASPWRWVAFGAGAGITWFSSNRAESFQKVYLQPYIVDVKPMAMSKAAADWRRQILVIRYNTLVYPTGFEAGRFHDGNPSYPAELLHQVGFYFDLQPLVEHFAQ